MTEYLKMVPLPSWWQELDLNEFPISELFEYLLSWNLKSKLITPKYITGTYFGAFVAIFNFCLSVCFLYIMFISTPWAGPKSRSCHLFWCNPDFWRKNSLFHDRDYWKLDPDQSVEIQTLVGNTVLCKPSLKIRRAMLWQSALVSSPFFQLFASYPYKV